MIGVALKNVVFITLAGWALAAVATAAEVRHLTPDEAAALAVTTHPALTDARRVAAAERLAARLLPNPNVTASHEQVVGSQKDLRNDAYSVGIEWEITRLITRGPALRFAEATYAAAGLKAAWDEFQIQNTARLEVVKTVIAERAVAVAVEAQKNLTVNAAQIRAAGTSETEMISAAADAAARQSDVTRLENERALLDERLALNSAVGLPPEVAIVPVADLTTLRSAPLPAYEVAAAAVEKHRPDLLALALGKTSQDAKLRAAILGRFPAVTLGVQQARDTGNIETRGVTLTFSLPIFDRGQGAIATATATRQQLANEYTLRLAVAQNDVAKALADMRLIRLQLTATEKALAARVRLSNALETAYRSAGMESATVYTARNDVTTSRSDLLKLETALAEAASALALATGTDFFRAP